MGIIDKKLTVVCTLTLMVLHTLFSCSPKEKNDNKGHCIGRLPPKLVLQITVDQLRGDLPERFMDRMGEGGFKYLLANGVHFKDAHHAHANTETIVGHTTLATGANPSTHGMIGNVWLNRTTGYLEYNVEDPRYTLLSADADVNKATEIDPTQKKARSSGRSPANIEVSTFSDELSLKTNGKAKVFGVSVKDRGAVSMAGHTGKAFWFSKANGEFVTSNYYYDAYPAWVKEWNAQQLSQHYANTSWELLQEKNSYLFADNDDQEWELALPGFGRLFPHAFGAGDNKYYTTFLTLGPAGDELTVDFAKALIDNESLGADEITDYLSVSLSSTDYVGHVFGPSSLEMEDNLLRLDRTLADLLSYVDEKVGLDRTLVVLSADHGSPEAPGYLRELGIEANTVNPREWDKHASIAKLKKRFGIGEEIIKEYFHPYIYLNNKVIDAKGLDIDEVQKTVAEQVALFNDVAYAVTAGDLVEGEVPLNPVMEAVSRNHHAERSGDIYIVFKPHRFVNDFDGLKVASTHGSPWSYDTYVPVIFAGNGLSPRTVYRTIYTVDVAPTLARYVGCKLPSGSQGQLLEEVLLQKGG